MSSIYRESVPDWRKVREEVSDEQERIDLFHIAAEFGRPRAIFISMVTMKTMWLDWRFKNSGGSRITIMSNVLRTAGATDLRRLQTHEEDDTMRANAKQKPARAALGDPFRHRR